MTPTPDDLTRDLAADLEHITAAVRRTEHDSADVFREALPDLAAAGQVIAPAAIRRALAAEREVAECRQLLDQAAEWAAQKSGWTVPEPSP